MKKLEFVIAPQLGEGQLISSVTKQEVLECAKFHWETRLTPEEGEDIVKSPVYQVRIPELTKWQMELRPNYVDAQGTRHLSFFVRLVESEKEELTACFEVFLGTQTETGKEFDYVKEGGLFNFTKDVPRYGFQNFIEMYRIESKANPLGDRFRFILDLKLFAELKPGMDLLNRNSPAEPYNPDIFLDARLRWQDNLLPVDSTRLSRYSSVFRAGFREQLSNPNLIINIDKYFETKCMAERVIEFCHNDGKLKSGPPKRPEGLKKMIKATEELGIPLLKEVCQREYLKELKPKYFVDTMDMVRDNVMDEEETMPILVEYLLENFSKVKEEDNRYKETYPEYKELYRRYLLGKPSAEGNGSGPSPSYIN